MSLIILRNFKRAKAQDAQDAQGDEVIAQKNGYKLVHNTLNDGYWFYTKSGAGWGITATNKVAAVNEFNRLVGSAKDAAEELKSANGKVLKVGSLVVPMSFTDKENKRHLSRVVLKIIPKGKSEFGPYVFLKGGIAPYKPNDLYAFDGCEDSAQFKIGDLVRMNEGGLTGKITKIEPNGHFRVSFLYNKANGFSQSFSANEIVMVKPAADASAAKFHE